MSLSDDEEKNRRWLRWRQIANHEKYTKIEDKWEAREQKQSCKIIREKEKARKKKNSSEILFSWHESDARVRSIKRVIEF